MADKQLRLDFAQTALMRALMSGDEIYERATTEFLRGLPEDRRIERKPATVHAEQLGSVYFPMWANTPDGGLLVVGIEDDGTISGCHSLDSEKTKQTGTSWTRLLSRCAVDFETNPSDRS